MADKIRIKDIAERAGTSVGTVDRVLHGRPNVSKSAREKIEKALQEMDYKANMYASALARNRSYNFVLLIPQYEAEAYWAEIEKGTVEACEARRDFHIHVDIIQFDRFSNESFLQQCRHCLEAKPDGVVLVPSEIATTQAFTNRLHDLDIPFVLLDSNMPELRPLAFFGQDSQRSGYFAARILMLVANAEKEVLVMRLTKGGNLVSRQQENREVGFRRFMEQHHPDITITTLDLPIGRTQEEYNGYLADLLDKHPNIHYCITFNSKAYILGEYILAAHRSDLHAMGYDMLARNAQCLRQGSVSFLVAQHAFVQGYSCLEALFRAIVLKKEITYENYMPIELITPENVDFYRRNIL